LALCYTEARGGGGAVLVYLHCAGGLVRSCLVRIFVGAVGVILLFFVLWDAFETVILPRRVTRVFRLARVFLRSIWKIWSPVARLIHSGKRRETYLSFFGPISLLMLFALWAWSLVLADAILQWAAGSAVVVSSGGHAGFRADFYLSGTTFFTLGLGDVVPQTIWARGLCMIEAGTGFGFLAIVISYLPTLYGAFSQREVNISLLDARAGTPPTAAELLRRHGRRRVLDSLGEYLRAWEIWSAQLMESHLTYPVLCFFRSQHDNQSWIAGFTAILDVCALIIAYGEGEAKWQAQLTFAIARHAVADLAEILKIAPRAPQDDRLPPADLAYVRGLLVECGGGVPGCADTDDLKLKELRVMYEPYLNGLSHLLMMPMPSWGVHPVPHKRATLWERITSDIPGSDTGGEAPPGRRDHF
jgi:hypothetical protein